jgi:hypothetical protein
LQGGCCFGSPNFLVCLPVGLDLDEFIDVTAWDAKFTDCAEKTVTGISVLGCIVIYII